MEVVQALLNTPGAASDARRFPKFPPMNKRKHRAVEKMQKIADSGLTNAWISGNICKLSARAKRTKSNRILFVKNFFKILLKSNSI